MTLIVILGNQYERSLLSSQYGYDIRMSWIPVAIILGALGLYALSKDQPRCPNCKAFVAKNSKRCSRCGAPLGWK